MKRLGENKYLFVKTCDEVMRLDRNISLDDIQGRILVVIWKGQCYENKSKIYQNFAFTQKYFRLYQSLSTECENQKNGQNYLTEYWSLELRTLESKNKID